jgi:hypothetical protein
MTTASSPYASSNPSTPSATTPAGSGKSLPEVVAPVREIAAFLLLGAVALQLLAGLTNLVRTEAQQNLVFFESYNYYLGANPPGFLTLVTAAGPLVAVLMVTAFGDPAPRAKVVTTIAAALLAVAIFFGLIFEVLLGAIGVMSELSFLDGMKEVALPQLVTFLVAAVSLVVVFRIWQGMFYVARPKPAAPAAGWPGYGYQAPYGQQGYPQQPGQAQPQYGQQQQYAQQPTAQYGQQSAYPQQQPYGQSAYQQPQAQQPQQPQQPAYGQPTQQYGQQPAQSAQPTQVYGQSYAAPPAAPASTPPAPVADEDPDRTGIVQPPATPPGSPAGGGNGDEGNAGEERWRAPS